MVMVNVPEAVSTAYVPAWLETVTVKVYDAAVVGVPEIRPPVESWRPGGRDPEASANVNVPGP